MQELRLDYTDCISDAPDLSDGFESMPSSKVHTSFKSSNSSVNARWAVEKGVKNITLDRSNERITGDRCHVRFTIPEDMGAPVFFYYYLTNFYQNHRRYVESFNSDQLKGQARTKSQISGSKCDPLDIDDKGDNATGLPFYPCGLIANSMFNDSFSQPRRLDAPQGEDDTYPMSKDGVAWSSDKDLYGNTTYKIGEVVPPPNWHDRYPDGYTQDNPPPDLKEWEAFQVWMRTAGLPTFSKLYQKNENEDMREGAYEVVVDYCKRASACIRRTPEAKLTQRNQSSPRSSTEAPSPSSSAPAPSWEAGTPSSASRTWPSEASASSSAPSSPSPTCSSRG